MKCVGLLGELAGYEHGFSWSLPLVELDGQLLAPPAPRWGRDDLRTAPSISEGACIEIPALEIDLGSVLLWRGPTYRANQNGLGIGSRIEWVAQVHEFDLAVGSLARFEDEEQRLRDHAMSAYWTALVESHQDDCRSAMHLLRVSGQLDRVTPILLRAVFHGRFLDPVGLEKDVELARARVGVEPAELIEKAGSLVRTLGAANPAVAVDGLLADLSSTLDGLSPVLRLEDLRQQKPLPSLVEAVVREVEKSVKQAWPVRLRSAGVRRGQVLSTPALALLAHLLRTAKPGERLRLDNADTPATPALERTGLIEVLGSTGLGTQLDLAVTHVEIRRSASVYHVVGFHTPPDKTYDQTLPSEIRRWVETACASAPSRHRDKLVRAISQLLDNVRDHASMTRAAESVSGVYLSVTKGGGDESTNRLTATVFDNGGGIRASLERESGALHSPTSNLVEWLFLGDVHPDEADHRALDPTVGAGFREITATVKRVGEFAYEHDNKPARSHLTVITSSRRDGGTELVVADLLAQDGPWSSTLPSPTEVTGTTIVFSIPLASDSAHDHLEGAEVVREPVAPPGVQIGGPTGARVVG